MKLKKAAPAWHKEAAEILRANFATINSLFLDSTKKAVWLGIFLNYLKARGKEDKSIPHGQFGPWLELNVPEIARSQLTVYMALGRNVAEKAKFQIAGFRQFAHGGELPAPVAALVEGKTQNQLFLEFKQAEDDDDGIPEKKRGRLKGQGGASREQRAAAQQREDEEQLDALKLDAEKFAAWADDNADHKHLGAIRGSKEWNALKVAVLNLAGYMNATDTAAKGGAK